MNEKKQIAEDLRVINAGKEVCNSDHIWGPGIRDQYIIHYVLEGKGYYECAYKKYYLNAGDSFIIFPNVPMKYYPDKDDPWTYTWVGFVGNAAMNLISQTGFSAENAVLYKCKNDPSLIFKKIVELDCNLSPMAICRSKGLLYMLISHYIENYATADRPSNETELINIAIEYINKNIHKSDLTIDKLADTLNINRISLYRKFKAKLGTSPSQYIIDARMTKAMELLKNDTIPVKNIAYSVGYSDQMYFARAFRRYTGNTPSYYRKYHEW